MQTVIDASPDRAASAAADQERSQALLMRIARGEIDGAIRIWRPARALALSRLDELRPGASRARELARGAAFDPVQRVSGGHAVVLGDGSFCVAFGERAKAFEGTQERYERLTRVLLETFASVGVDAEQGELEGEWCPGTWSIRSGGVKLAGLAQRAVQGAAWCEAVVDLAPDEEARELLHAVYKALDLPLDPRTLGSLSELTDRVVLFEELSESLLPALQA